MKGAAPVDALPSAIDLVYLCDWLPPDFGAVGQYALQQVRARAQLGERVVLYGLSARESSVQIENIGSGQLTIVRIHVPLYDRTRFLARAWWTLRVNALLVGSAFRHLKASREVLFTGSPPFLIHLLGPLNLFLRKSITYRISDFFPECMMAEYSRAPLLLRLIYWATLFWRRRIAKFEVLGEDQRRRLLDSGIRARRIVVKRDTSPVRIDASTRSLPRPPELAGYRVLLYSGNFGVAHDSSTFLEGFLDHHRRGNGRVALWLNAVGGRAEQLHRELKRNKLPHFRSKPVPIEQLAQLLITADAHLITLRDQFWGYVLPSKVYGCIESRRPILYVGPKASDVHLLCSSVTPAISYLQIGVGDAQGVYGALQSLGEG